MMIELMRAQVSWSRGVGSRSTPPLSALRPRRHYPTPISHGGYSVGVGIVAPSREENSRSIRLAVATHLSRE